MAAEPKTHFGVSAPADMPDEMGADVSTVRHQHTETDVIAHAREQLDPLLTAELPRASAITSVDSLARVEVQPGISRDPFTSRSDGYRCAPHAGTQPAGDLYRAVFGPCETVHQSDKYASLENVLHRAIEQASAGKSAERHATGQAFESQPMQTISRLVGSHHGLIFQSIKKAQESTRLPTVERQVAELLGAINYLAGAIIYLESPK